MQDQKIENLLNLALDATAEERERSLELDVGYEPAERTWELIVKYSGSLEAVRALGASVTELLNEYAVILIEEAQIDRLSEIPEIEYIEKPKRLFFQVAAGRAASCIFPLQSESPEDRGNDREGTGRSNLKGRGVLVAVLDSGIAYESRDFRHEDGSTRILNLWDQTIPGNPPKGYGRGTEYTKVQIDEALRLQNPEERRQRIPSSDFSGHGTPVAAIAAGNGGGRGTAYAGVAPESDLLVVKLGNARQEGFPRTTELMMGLNYVVEKALEYRRPVAVNLSFGNTYGAHDGNSLLERFIDDLSNYWKSVICVGSGNEGNSAGHTAVQLETGRSQEVQFAVSAGEPVLNVQIWKNYTDEIEMVLESPSGQRAGPIQERLGTQRLTLDGTEILLYYGKPSPYSTNQEIYLDFLSANAYVADGIWKIYLIPRKLVLGTVAFWLPSQAVLNRETAFLFPRQNTTLTIPSTAQRVITVGAYDARTVSYADFSGRGSVSQLVRAEETTAIGGWKPDLCAPGVGVITLASVGIYREFSGTSFATPFVTGSAALLMEWGIVRGNDPFLYGEKVKAYLRRGAKPLPGMEQVPDNREGFGRLCVAESIPEV